MNWNLQDKWSSTQHLLNTSTPTTREAEGHTNNVGSQEQVQYPPIHTNAPLRFDDIYAFDVKEEEDI